LSNSWPGTPKEELKQMNAICEKRFIGSKTEYRKASEKPNQEEYADNWQNLLKRLELLRRRLDEGPFVLRLKIALGKEFEFDSEEENGEREYGCEKRCRKLAEEAVANPALLSEDAWQL